MKTTKSEYFLRYALGITYLSAVADRFGLWGAVGTGSVAWGDFASFTEYTRLLLYFMPDGLIPMFAWVATILEIVIALFLMIGFRIKLTAFASAALLGSFYVSMTIALGFEAPLSYSVLTACAASFYLGAQQKGSL